MSGKKRSPYLFIILCGLPLCPHCILCISLSEHIARQSITESLIPPLLNYDLPEGGNREWAGHHFIPNVQLLFGSHPNFKNKEINEEMRRIVGCLRAKMLSQTICNLVKVRYGALHNRSSTNNTINYYCNITAAAEIIWAFSM